MGSTFGLEAALRKEGKRTTANDKVYELCRKRAVAMYEGQNDPVKEIITDPHTYIGASPPRRAGKSYGGGGALALITGEAKPNSISYIISLTLPQIKKIYWTGPGAIIPQLDRKYGLNLQFHGTELRWTHENGSIGYLLSAEDKDRMEYLRGIEADLYVIDECQAFAPGALRYLVETIIEPQRSSRNGRTVLIGTPGPIEAGPFYEATCERAFDEVSKLPTSVLFGEKDSHGRDMEEAMLWSRHHWTLEQNKAKPQQWRDALRKKKAKRWADDHPTWMREYLGKWTGSTEGLVFRYLLDKPTGRVTWVPDHQEGKNATGLPPEGAPWRLVGGLDFGFEAPTAFVLCAYSQKLREVRHIADWSRTKMLVPHIAELLHEAQELYGRIDIIFADAGNLGKMILETLVREHGFPIERADKREKFDHIELLNAAFACGEVKILEGSLLETQLCSNQWDLENGTGDDPAKRREELAKAGKLKENPNIPNDSTDALLYLYRGAMHHFGNPKEERKGPEHGSKEWVRQWEVDQLRKYRNRPDDTTAARALKGQPRVPRSVRSALKPWKTTIPKWGQSRT